MAIQKDPPQGVTVDPDKIDTANLTQCVPSRDVTLPALIAIYLLCVSFALTQMDSRYGRRRWHAVRRRTLSAAIQIQSEIPI